MLLSSRQPALSIIDTGQVDYTKFFTYDATKYKVIIKVDTVTEWSGYLTPDSFLQRLTYRSTIELIARDNLGMLSDIAFDMTGSLALISNILTTALSKISFLCTLDNRVRKIDSTSTAITSGVVNIARYTDGTYMDALDTILRGIGCQLRFVGSNTYALFDIGKINTYGNETEDQEFIFIENSGVKEIIPAMREIALKQDYLVDEDVYPGYCF